ncbi:unnamed protein product [Polarella glacialis]|uniref:UBA domain-containing protein n=1 Tax=Polarella glacialis TaxID=89957 RepID=A0A813LT93_POLGL|nr:unnamed protein product [Polarella glacialis]
MYSKRFISWIFWLKLITSTRGLIQKRSSSLLKQVGQLAIGAPAEMGQILSELPCCAGQAEDLSMETSVAPPIRVDPAARAAQQGGAAVNNKSLKTLTDMGFTREQATEALGASDGNVDQATAILLSAAEDSPIVEDPFTIAAPPAPSVDNEAVQQIVQMGFTEQQAKNALDGASGNVERDVNLVCQKLCWLGWLFICHCCLFGWLVGRLLVTLVYSPCCWCVVVAGMRGCLLAGAFV